MTDPLTCSIAEAAEALGVSQQLVYELVARGDLPAIVLGRRKVIPRRALEMLMDRSLEGFDPDRVLSGLAGAARSSDVAAHADVEERTGTAGPETDLTSTSMSGNAMTSCTVAAQAAPVVPIRR